MKKKYIRLISFLLAIPVVANLIFSGLGVVNAADAEGGVHLSKTVTLQDDGTYTINLSGFVTGQTVTSQVTTHTPLDVVLVLDASSSMLKFSNTPETYMQTDDIPGWEQATKPYPSTATSKTNLFNTMSFRARYYSYDANKWSQECGKPDTGYPIRGSVLIPVKPGDKIYCSSFQDASVTGGVQDGICVAFFRSSGNLLKVVSAADVNAEYNNNKGYITVPSGAYVMNIPVWNSDSSKVIRNLSLGEERYNPVSKLEFEAVRAKILQEQVQSFADSLAKNALDTGVTHKLSIITYGGEHGTGVSNQGRYEKHMGVNGYNDFIYTNTGLFVNGEFKNYYNGNNDKADGVERAAYTPIFANELDTSKTYYYFEPSASADDIDGQIRTVTYNATAGEWVNPDGKNLVPQEEPYEYNSRTQFYTMKMVAPAKLNANDYKNAMPSILGTDNKINSVVQSAIDRYVARGTTHPELGLYMADFVLEKNPAKTVDANGAVVRESKQVVILFTDGQTNDLDKVDGEATYQTVFYRANRIKGLNKAELYTICLADSEDSKEATEMAKWLDQLSSNHPAVNGGNGSHDDAANIFDRSKAVSGGKYAKSIEDMSELSEIFTSITTDISTSQSNVQLGTDTVMQDYLANGLIFPEDFNFSNISVYTETIKTSDDVNFTFTNKRPFNNNGDGTYVLGGTTVTVTIDKAAGKIAATGFDYGKCFVSSGHSGNKLIVEVRGVEATEETMTDVLLNTNTKQSGIAYKDSDGKSGLYPFEQPKTQLESKTYVIDYAKPTTINAADWGNVIGIATADRLKVQGSVNLIETEYGTFEKNADGSAFTFTPETMQWDQPATFYVLRTLDADAVPEGVTTGDNQWLRVNVVPANNIYYEDDFSDIDYTGNWTTDGTPGNSTENPEGAAGDAEGVHGWEDSLKDPQYSDGASHKGQVDASTKAEASFTFTGKGVDIYSRTNTTTGTVLVTLRGGKYHEEYDGGYYEVSKTLIVDNLSESGDYYQIPTVSFMDLPYDTYTVTIRVTTAAAGRFAYYFDGVRIYKPLQDDIGYAVAEQGAEVAVIRDLLAANGKNSVVFIDKTEDGAVGAMKDYNATEYGKYGPKNEVYLAAGQSITFKVDIREDAYYYVGLKCPTGNANAVAMVSNGDETTLEIGIAHATDLYYHVTPDSDGYITIQNTGTGLLSVTKLRIAGPSQNPQVMTISEDEAVFAVRRFTMRTVTVKDGSFGDDWSPNTSDVGIPAIVWFVLIGACVALLVMVAMKWRMDYEA